MNLTTKTFFVTVSDDRSNRKGGRYRETQNKIFDIFTNNKQFGIDSLFFLKWSDILNSQFYTNHKKLLDHIDPAYNGRCYKPYAIQQALKQAEEGDFVIYNDVSPEWWEMASDYYIDPKKYDLSVIQHLCVTNGGMISAKVSWMAVDGSFEPHTHEYFTSDRCMNRMNMQSYRYCLQHASGMIVFQKLKKTVEFVDEWLYWNVIDECGGLKHIETGKCFWENEANIGKLGHRHDQSISGLLLNKINHKLIEVKPYWSPSPTKTYNFLSFCLKNESYSFVDSVIPMTSKFYKNVFQDGKWQVISATR